ncbi:tyramine beta-hydroxylase-like isoform X2 [Pecten maximus]|uniref:tyramine beta-hydroxylase-like isoform X2 n=1 Tax=Pecten maximus TaxID=6579 RepID=UPI0014585D33|nr:tyramine beta-hydroxylase-like isoform X2 [Pecten maximus]
MEEVKSIHLVRTSRMLVWCKWTRALCEMDSDGDGKTNGEELGDPACVWVKGNSPAATNGISHPGTCTPFSSPACKAANSWVDCEKKNTQCDARNDVGMKSVTIRMPETVVPTVATVYYCMLVELPTDGDYHLVSFEPAIDNVYVNHHILIFGCDDPEDAVRAFPLNKPTECKMAPEMQCMTLMGVWRYGSTGQCLNKNSGFRIGRKGYRYARIQYHWNNPEMRTDYTDKSGLKLYYTPNLRTYDATTWTVGTIYTEIPPGEEEFEVKAVCSSDCSSRYLSGPIYITRAQNHMHSLGRRQKIQQYRNGVWIRDITNAPYNYNDYSEFEFDPPIEILPGDEIKTTCTFRTVDQNRTIFIGDGTSDEMCFGFIIVYPAQHLHGGTCLSWKDIDMCKLNEFTSDFPTVKGCNVKAMMNPFHPDLVSLFSNLRTYCKPFGICTHECKHYVKNVVAKNPCFKGTANDLIRHMSISKVPVFMTYLAAIDSCRTEIEMDNCQEQCDSG